MAETSWRDRLTLIPWILLDILRHFFTENKSLKLVSLTIAFLMWYSISTKEQERTVENVPLTIVNRSGDTMVMNLPVKVVDVRVRGPVSVVDKLEVEDLTVEVDASGQEPGSYLLSPEAVKPPPSVEVLGISPSIIPVTLDALVTRQVPVKPQLDTSQLPPDHVLLGALATPPSVQLTGPASKVNEIKEVLTLPIKPDRIASGLTLTTGLVVPNQNMTIMPTLVTITVDLDSLVEKLITDIPLRLPRRVRSETGQTVSASLRGPKTLLDRIKRKDLTVKLDLKNLHRGEHQVSPLIELPEAFRDKVEVVSLTPDKIRVRIR